MHAPAARPSADPISGIICLVLQITLVGWILAACWAVAPTGYWFAAELADPDGLVLAGWIVVPGL